MQIPNLASHLDVGAFDKWVLQQGGEILTLTNEWEIIRYRLNDALHIIYKNKHGRLTYTGSSLDHMIEHTGAHEFVADTDLGRRGRIVGQGPNLQQVSKIDKSILERWGSATNLAREPSQYCSQSEDGREPSADHSEKPPWE